MRIVSAFVLRLVGGLAFAKPTIGNVIAIAIAVCAGAAQAKPIHYSESVSGDLPLDQPNEIVGLAWDSGTLWISDASNGSISRIDPWTNTIISSFTPFADVYANFPGGTINNNQIRDLAWDGSLIWAAYSTDPMLETANPYDIILPSSIYAFDPLDGSIVRSFVAPFIGHPGGLEWDGSNFWIGEDPNSENPVGRIYKVDPLSGLALDSFSTSFGNPRGLAWDGTAIWAGYPNDQTQIGWDQIQRHDPANGSVLTVARQSG